MVEGPLFGKRVLIVEDRYLLADDMRLLLQRAGAIIFGPVATAHEARDILADEQVDGVLLDIDLHGTLGFALADNLEARGISYIFVSGFDHTALPQRHREAPYLAKPVRARRLIRLLEETI